MLCIAIDEIPPALSTFSPPPRLPKFRNPNFESRMFCTSSNFRNPSIAKVFFTRHRSPLSQISISTSQMEANRFPCGEIHVIVGPMFANCSSSTNSSSQRSREVDVIGIDEAHEFCCKAADQDGKIVILAGLDGDYLRRSFGSVLDIVPIADSVTKLSARCNVYGKRAFFTLRKSEETQSGLIGGSDYYMPVCRQHYVNVQVVVEATRTVLKSKKVLHDSYLEGIPISS